MKICRTKKELSDVTGLWKDHSVGFVPTMGALHAGHLSLVAESQRTCDKTVVSIFVNPTQFAAHEDLDSYPRQEADDLAKLSGVDAVFLPTSQDMYPQGASTTVTVDGITDVLCGQSRPHFFGGVATIATKLFHLVQPTYAFFGLKDYQQFLVIQKMVHDLNFSTQVVGCETVREPDGLALSSRNAYLSAEERATASVLPQTLQTMSQDIVQGKDVGQILQYGKNTLTSAGFGPIDYLDYRDCTTLQILESFQPGGRLFVAANLGNTRLIDNRAVS